MIQNLKDEHSEDKRKGNKDVVYAIAVTLEIFSDTRQLITENIFEQLEDGENQAYDEIVNLLKDGIEEAFPRDNATTVTSQMIKRIGLMLNTLPEMLELLFLMKTSYDAMKKVSDFVEILATFKELMKSRDEQPDLVLEHRASEAVDRESKDIECYDMNENDAPKYRDFIEDEKQWCDVTLIDAKQQYGRLEY